ncbi:hypothetical protein ABT263_28080 [Kitasatospora sp. NPDC001603]|uniref:hypothetical protein n=1 Tax=Kitasatospora sp. NPDC001603 TaxID=3154388 RepID=UPI003321092F
MRHYRSLETRKLQVTDMVVVPLPSGAAVRHHRSITTADEGTEGWILLRTVPAQHHRSATCTAAQQTDKLGCSASSRYGTVTAAL